MTNQGKYLIEIKPVATKQEKPVELRSLFRNAEHAQTYIEKDPDSALKEVIAHSRQVLGLSPDIDL